MRTDNEMTAAKRGGEMTGQISQVETMAPEGNSDATSRASRWLDENLGGAGFVRRSMRHIFPDHWSFFLGEVALYCFVVLVVTGIFLSLFFKASGDQMVYHGSYEPLRGTTMSAAYSSVLQITFDVRGGLLIRQIHHWAALVFIGALLLHVCRMFFTGAYRRPRRANWLIGVTLLILVISAGFTGYSAPDDMLSGTGLRITFSIIESIPLIGPWLAFLIFGGSFPSADFVARLFPLHIFLLPGLIAGLLGVHLAILWRQKHTVFRDSGGDDKTIVGTRFFPNYALRSGGYFFLVGGMLAALGAFLQLNPVWLYGPYSSWSATSAAQPDWYTGWLEGALRLFPAWDIHIGGFLLPAIFWPGVVLPLLLIGFLYYWPWLDVRITGDRGVHNVLQGASERPGRTALGAAILAALAALFVAGGDDVIAVIFGGNFRTIVWVLRGCFLGLTPTVALITYYLCRLRRRPTSRMKNTSRGAGPAPVR
ncbi:MAG: cytochrome bc complex cytochrome b subunit [Actinobacteria bacterium]|nr:cytochrome bc complex cytochrome b subunit [Actinomycetota bacterium]